MEFSYVIEKEKIAEELKKAKDNSERNEQGFLMFWKNGLVPRIDEFGTYTAVCDEHTGIWFHAEDFTTELIMDIFDKNPSLINDALVRKVVELFLTKNKEDKAKD